MGQLQKQGLTVTQIAKLLGLSPRAIRRWLAAARGSGIAELESFAKGIEQDQAAVVAGLTLPDRNGVVEGHVNRLRLIKRMMYGRADFPLLRQRVLHCA